MTAPLSRREAIRARIMICVEIVDTGYVDAAGRPSPCHLWTGPDSGTGRGGGYPRMSLDGQTVAVHIVNWTNEHGFIPGKKQLDHLCRTRRCVREDHLEMVTHKQNQKRRDKARQPAKGPMKCRAPRKSPKPSTSRRPSSPHTRAFSTT